MSKIYIEDIALEHLFDWFEDAISASGGDGAAVICCANPSEAADIYIAWWKNKTGRTEFWHPRDEYVRDGVTYINFHDSNENYMFCNKGVDLGFGDYSFIIKKDCGFAWHGHPYGDVKVMAVTEIQ